MTGEPGRLTLVGTPLGNRGDLSPRAREALLAADVLLCEDTRSPGRLLGEVRLPPRMSCFAGNEEERVGAVLERLAEGAQLVYVSEAGMPVWSDPGARLVRAVVDAGYALDVIPGPTAVATAVALSGFTGSDVHFLGFPPRAGSARARLLQRVAAAEGTTVLYEAPGRVGELIDALAASCGPAPRRAVVARELTKLHQEVLRGTLSELAATVRGRGSMRGEMTVVIEGRPSVEEAPEDDARAAARAVWDALHDDALKPRQRAKRIAALTGLENRVVYEQLRALRER
ncbi:MAG: rRNA small subunit methyltransferase 1 [Myxococcales bacterium]|nr:rRNA small subunit methyltransferase 1 [Myxococcales bacterium]